MVPQPYGYGSLTLSLTLTLTLALSLTRYKPFLDRLSLDKVENIPRYITETATVLIAVTTHLFESYWCAVELCKAVECHAQGTLNIILCPIQVRVRVRNRVSLP